MADDDLKPSLWEGFIGAVGSRLRSFWNSDPSQAPLELAKGDVYPRNQPGDVFSLYGYETVASYLKLDQDLISRYVDFEEMDEYAELSSALDIYADDMCQVDSQMKRVVWATAEDRTVQEIVDDLYHRTLNLDDESWSIARTMCKYGNSFEELIVTQDGVRALNYLPPASMRRIEGPKGQLYGFIQDFKGRFNFTPADYLRLLRTRHGGDTQSADLLDATKDERLENAPVFEDFEVCHFRMRSKTRRSTYSTGVLEAARWIWKRLVMLEDSALIYRLERGPQRRAFYIDTGDLPPHEAMNYLNQVRMQHRKKKFYNPRTGKIDVRFDVMPVAHDTPIPLLDGRTVSIKDMTQEHEDGAEHWVYSVNPDTGNLAPGRVSWVGRTREVSPALKITFDDGNYAVMAPDHPVMRRDRSYANAEDLCVGDSVMPLYREISSKSRNQALPGYERVYQPAREAWRFTHSVMAESAHGYRPPAWITHHVNFQKLDNTPPNLRYMDRDSHLALHQKAGHAGGVAVARMRKLDPVLDEKLKAGPRRYLAALKKTPRWGRLVAARNRKLDQGRFIRAYNTSPQHKEDNEIRSKAMKALWADPARREQAKQNMRLKFPAEVIQAVGVYLKGATRARCEAVVKFVNSTPELLEALRAANPTRTVESVHRHMLLHMYRGAGFEGFKAFARHVRGPTNHKVVSIEVVDPCDHYCMTVETYHNFALSLRDANGVPVWGSGVFVKNSQMEDFYIPNRNGKDASRIEVLQSPQWQDMSDINYFKDKMWAAVKAPKAYLGGDDGVVRTTLSSQDVRFARTVLRGQRGMTEGYHRIGRVHLAALGIPPNEAPFTANMTIPSAIFELAQIEVLNAKADLSTRMRGLDFSTYYIMSEVFGMSDDAIKMVTKQHREEHLAQAANDATAGQILNPPPPPGAVLPAPQARPALPTPAPKAKAGPANMLHSSMSEDGIQRGSRADERKARDEMRKVLDGDNALSRRLAEIKGLLQDLSYKTNK